MGVLHRPTHRPAFVVLLLAACDYALWRWSSEGNNDVVALVSGVALTLLLIAVVWLVARGAGHLLADVARRMRDLGGARREARVERGSRTGRRAGTAVVGVPAQAAGAGGRAHGGPGIARTEADAEGAAPVTASSSKLAA